MNATMWVPAWIRLTGLPLHFWAEKNLKRIASVIGEPVFIDEFTKDRSRTSYARICVRRNIAKPLMGGVWLRTKEACKYFQKIMYEGVAFVCTACGLAGYGAGTCPSNGGVGNLNGAAPKPEGLDDRTLVGSKWRYPYPGDHIFCQFGWTLLLEVRLKKGAVAFGGGKQKVGLVEPEFSLNSSSAGVVYKLSSIFYPGSFLIYIYHVLFSLFGRLFPGTVLTLQLEEEFNGNELLEKEVEFDTHEVLPLKLDEGSIQSLEDGMLGESAGDQSNMEEALTINYDEIIGEKHGKSIVIEGDVASEKVKMTVGHCPDEVELIVEDGDEVSGKMKMTAAHTSDEVQPIMEEGRVDVSEVMNMTAARASNEVEATNSLELLNVPIAEPICSVETLEVKAWMS